MPPTMANSNYGQDHKDNYFYTSKKILSQEMDHVQYGNSYVLFFFRNYNKCLFFKWSNVKVKMLSTSTKILSQAIFMWNINALALTIQILLTGSKYSKRRPHSKVKVTRVKNVGTHGKVLILKILMWNIKTLAFTILMLLTKL